MHNMWSVTRIDEADYGCEERMPGEPLLVLVTIESDDGRMCRFECAENWLLQQGIDEGDEWPEDVGRILRTFKIKKNVEVTDNGKIII